MQLRVVLLFLFAILFITLIKAQSTPPTPPPSPPPTPTPRPACQLERCPPRSPAVCAGNSRGQCRLVQNSCVLKKLNCDIPTQKWRTVKKKKCKKMKVGKEPKKCAK